jgi:hypothetical protein
MNGDFERVWTDIQQRLRPDTFVKNWNARRGYTGGGFQIRGVDDAAVIVQAGQMGQERRVSRGDFQRVFTLWDAYNQGTMSRSELGKVSQNTTYILRILHWREETLNSEPQTAPASSAIASPQPATVSATGVNRHDRLRACVRAGQDSVVALDAALNLIAKHIGNRDQARKLIEAIRQIAA